MVEASLSLAALAIRHLCFKPVPVQRVTRVTVESSTASLYPASAPFSFSFFGSMERATRAYLRPDAATHFHESTRLHAPTHTHTHTHT